MSVQYATNWEVIAGFFMTLILIIVLSIITLSELDSHESRLQKIEQELNIKPK